MCNILNKHWFPIKLGKYFTTRGFIFLLNFEKKWPLSIANAFQNILSVPHFEYFSRKPSKVICFSGKYIPRFQNWSLFFRIETLLTESNLLFWNWNFVSNLLKNSNSKLRFQHLITTQLGRLVSRIVNAIPKKQLRFRKQNFNSGWKSLTLNWNNNLETKHRFRKENSILCECSISILKTKLQFWKREIYLPEKRFCKKQLKRGNVWKNLCLRQCQFLFESKEEYIEPKSKCP